MNKKQKEALFKVIFFVVLAVVLWILIFMNLKITETTPAFVSNQHEWTNSLIANIRANYIPYAFLLGLVGFGLYFLLRKKRK